MRYLSNVTGGAVKWRFKVRSLWISGQYFHPARTRPGGFEKVRDFDKSKGDLLIQQADKATGLPLWVIEVIDPQEGTRQLTVKVKVVSEYQPALPSPAPGSPFVAVEFEGLMATPYVDGSRCKAARRQVRRAGSRTAEGHRGSRPSAAAQPPGARAQGRGLMPARRVPALALPVDAKAGVSFRGLSSTARRC